MSTLTRDRYYPDSYHEYDDEPEEDIHPQMRRRAEQIVRRQRMTRLRQWWISSAGAATAIAAVTGMVLAGLNLVLAASAVTAAAALLALYLTSLALKPLNT